MKWCDFMQWSKLLCEERVRKKQKKSDENANQSVDLRNEFQKDYHRIIGSASFRRLQDKTQVFPLDKSDFVRTRLTHSIEVSSFAKSLGQNIFTAVMRKGLDDEVTPEVKEKACSVLECAGLIHDLGNPPFGHFGEETIHLWFERNFDKLEYNGQKLTELFNDQMKNDFLHIDGNAHALRMVSKLHVLIDDNGMNLTYPLLNTIIKYPVKSTQINKASGNVKDKKAGYYYSENDLYQKISTATGAVDCRHPLAFILEAADDIAYKTADIEDAVKKGLISYDRLVKELKSDRFIKECKTEKETEYYKATVERLEILRKRAEEKGIVTPEMNAVQNWMVYVQGKLIGAASDGFTDNYSRIMQGTYGCELLKDSKARVIAYALSDIAYRYAFRTSAILKLEIGAAAVFNFLLDKLVIAAINYDDENTSLNSVDEKLMTIVSDNYKYIYKSYSKDKSMSEKLYLRIMLIIDFISGMTDSYAKSLYQEFNGIS